MILIARKTCHIKFVLLVIELFRCRVVIMKKVCMIGAGNLGSSIAYEIANRDIANEIVLIDLLRDFAEGQADDIQQAVAQRNDTIVSAGNYDELADSDITIVTAGKPRTPDIKSRLELAGINAKIIKSVASELRESGFGGIIITLTNPMDLMNHIICKSGFDRDRVIGSGGQLDSARFRVVLSRLYNAHSSSVEAHVLGEHGDSQVPVFSNVKINGKRKTFSEDEKKKIREELKAAALNVISKKGATIFAPANNTADMVESILDDQKTAMMCSVVLNGEYGINNVSIGVPVVLCKNGVEKILEWGLDEDELAMLQQGAYELKKHLQSIGE